MGSWADIHRDILQVIAEKFTHHMDFLHFAAVCKPWRSFAMDNLHRLPHELPLRYCLPLQNPVPLLMHFNDAEAEGRLDFFSIVDRKYVSGFFLPEINQKWIAGSSNGWLFMIEMNGQEVHLLNPFTRAQIPLPSPSTFQHPGGDDFIEDEDFGFIEKAVISSNPNRRSSGGDCIVMAIISYMAVLSFCRPGDDKWTNLEGSMAYLSDVVPYKGQFYAITEMGTTIVCDATGDGNVKEIVNGGCGPRKRHLVESASGDLLHVARIMDEDTESFTTDFDLYKLEAVDESKIDAMREFECNLTLDGAIAPQREFGFRWVKLESLGDQVLFLGHNCSLCLPSQSVPGCKRNCVYFTDDDDGRYAVLTRNVHESDDDILFHRGVSVYDVENRSIEPFGETKDKPFVVPPVWISPNPW